ncbi:pyrroloquinoline quinone biosynthesis protein PqqB [Streptomyces sp. SID13031]|uniref:pyrroloquinoline quinone biosynthesis protein PqqB n=1 Tax=Streptomyces sp. SID13031 TaxID=2706046 RepID=UPI0013C979FB|nr:pyrroloquinoline quinone biosynthesis protein PqqB [Streptomyces sp. SID13031]NEA35015.1 pyrroloquinoline quinone biosynthesis protein PqqB [Streptomyces sp. SID13031]
MRAILLGTAAGGGFPQWNCACPTCSDPGLVPRTQDGLAISADGNGWYLVNASPDIRAQILATKELRAGPGPRETPIKGVFLTDAELDHTLGLMMLREGVGLEVFAPPAVLQALKDVRSTLSKYGAWTWSTVGSDQYLAGLRVKVLAVSNKQPKYVTSTTGDPWVVAYRFEDPATGGVLVYAPCLATWPDGFDEFVDGAAYVVLDGTFHDGGEMADKADSTAKAQTVMGHLPIEASLERIRKLSAAQPGTAWAYTHLNNTNPALDPATSQYAGIRAAGVKIPPDGTVLVL